jgi:hypothetical protein
MRAEAGTCCQEVQQIGVVGYAAETLRRVENLTCNFSRQYELELKSS